MDVVIKSKMKKRRVEEPRARWWNFTRQNAARLLDRIKAEGSGRHVDDADIMWAVMVECIRRSTKDALGISRVAGSQIKGAW